MPALTLRPLLLLVFLGLLGGCAALHPTAQGRPWQEEVSRVALVQFEGDGGIVISNLRNWEWDADGAVTRRWETRRYRLEDVRGLWFNVEPFDANDCFAHTSLTFELAGDAFLSVSVEARKREGEVYSPLRGAFGAFPLIFVWSSERDMLTNAAVTLGREVQSYPVNATPEQARAILEGFLDRTNQLAFRPELYNTLRRNCTTELAAVVNRVFDQPIPRDASFFLTGRSPQTLHRLGFLGDPGTPFATLQAEARRDEAIRRHATLPERQFSRAIRR